MTEEANQLIQALAAARVELWAALDALPDAQMITPEWNKRDFYAHIAGWDAMIFITLRDGGFPVAERPYPGVDAVNAQSVAERQSASQAQAKLESEIERYATDRQLEAMPDDAFDQSMQFPWGPETLIGFLEGAIEHERKHAEDIRALKPI